jgi:hypothetical protein
MRRDDLQHLLNAVPFYPFRVVMYGGTVYIIRHPELVRAGRSSWWHHYVPPPPGFSERYDILSYLLVERIEVSIPIPTSSNGG